MLESTYQNKLIKKIKKLLPKCIIHQNDPTRQQGVPDLVIFNGPRWAMLEVKISPTADIQPNQEYWVEAFDEMSYASFIFPENEEVVLNELQQALRG